MQLHARNLQKLAFSKNEELTRFTLQNEKTSEYSKIFSIDRSIN